MSKNHKNYTRYSKMNTEENTNVESEVTIEDTVAEDESATMTEVEGQTAIPEVEHASENTVAVTEEPEADTVVETKVYKIGKVNDCKKLNVRVLPDRGSKIVCELVVGAEVMIDTKASTALFYKVCTEAGVEGYCMKDYIKVLN